VQREGTILTRQEGKLYIDRYKTREEQKMLLRDGFETYNNLPQEIKMEQNLQEIIEGN